MGKFSDKMLQQRLRETELVLKPESNPCDYSLQFLTVVLLSASYFRRHIRQCY